MEKLNTLLDFQKRIGIIVKDAKNPHFKNTYATLGQILSEVKPILNELGLTLTQPILNNKVCTFIKNEKGEVIGHSEIDLPNNLSPQNLGSAITYFRRYTLSGLLALEIEDDDAQSTTKVMLPNLDAAKFESCLKGINDGKKEDVIKYLKGFTISYEYQNAIDLALKNN